MKTISRAAIAALLSTSLGIAAIAPAVAQPTPPTEQSQAGKPAEQRNFRPGPHGPHGIGGPGPFLSLERGAEAIEVAIVRLSHRLDLTADQQGLLDTLKADALAAAETFAKATEGLRPTRPTAGEAAERPDFSARFENQIALQKAQLAAFEAVQPALSAFFDSLSEDQQAKLSSQRGEFGGHGKGPHQGQGRPGGNGHGSNGNHGKALQQPPATAPTKD